MTNPLPMDDDANAIAVGTRWPEIKKVGKQMGRHNTVEATIVRAVTSIGPVL